MPQELRDIWTDAYKFHAAHIPMGRDVAAWQACYNEAMRILREHNHHPLALKLLLAVYDYMADEQRADCWKEVTL